MNTPLCRQHRESAITRTEIIVIVVVLGIVGALIYSALIVRPQLPRHGALPDQLNNGRQIYLAIRNYAEDRVPNGAFPTFRDPDSKMEPFTNSNEALEALVPRYLDDVRPFFNRKSAWCRVLSGPNAHLRGKPHYPFPEESPVNRIFPGENDWVYVRGLRADSPEDWPVLANAFAPGTLEYVTDAAQRGGVWRGKKAVIVHANGSAQIIETQKSGDTYFIPRADKLTANAFAKDGEWLAGEHVEVLYPLPPPAGK